jgi:hypothetical protein
MIHRSASLLCYTYTNSPSVLTNCASNYSRASFPDIVYLKLSELCIFYIQEYVT